MREICFIVVGDKLLRVYFGSATRVPDSRERWEVIWDYREEITEIVHSHPGELLDFSHEDLTTMQAIEAGTGKQFTWSIVTETRLLSRKAGINTQRNDSPWWLEVMRKLSYGGMQNKTIKKGKNDERTDQHYLAGSKRKLPGQYGSGRG